MKRVTLCFVLSICSTACAQQSWLPIQVNDWIPTAEVNAVQKAAQPEKQSQGYWRKVTTYETRYYYRPFSRRRTRAVIVPVTRNVWTPGPRPKKTPPVKAQSAVRGATVCLT